jgi:tRNA (cmo5U34)-methyltransferase
VDAEGEWRTQGHAEGYLARADSIPHRSEGEAVLLEELPDRVGRVLDLGAGDGRLLGLVLASRPGARGVAVDYSPPMLERARRRFAPDGRVEVVEHDLGRPLPDLGRFDLVVSSFAIHHVVHERKRELYAEVLELLEPGGRFLNLEHVSSPTGSLHLRFLSAMGITPEEEDRTNKLLDVETQVRWFREIGFADADCLWKWLELALLAGRRPAAGEPR